MSAIIDHIDHIDGIPLSPSSIDGVPLSDDIDGIPFVQFSQVLTETIHQARLTSGSLQDLPPHFAIPCFQLNSHRSLGPLDNLQHHIVNSPSTSEICFLQEPPFNSSLKITGVNPYFDIVCTTEDTVRPRAALLLSKSISTCCTPLTAYTSQDLAAARISNAADSDIIICSFYWHGDLNSIPPELSNLCSMAHSRGLPLIIGGDVNAHHKAWGSNDTNKRGEILMEFLLNHKLSFYNDGSMTFHNVLRSEVLDITMGNPSASSIISNWETSTLPSLSDHSLILFDIKARQKPHQPDSSNRSRSTKLSNIEYSIFEEKLADLVSSHSKALSLSCDTSIALNDKVELIHNLIQKAFKSSKTSHYVSNNSIRKKLQSPWWTRELHIARKNTKKCWNRYKRTLSLSDLSSYKKTNNKYLKMIKQNKATSWEKHCSDTSSSMAATSKLLKKLKHKKTTLSSIKKSDGNYTETIMETLSAITDKDNLSSIPPFSSVTQSHPLLPSDNTPSSSSLDLPIDLSICTLERIDKAFITLNKGKAPGPDKITNELLTHCWPTLKSIITNIFRDSIRLGVIPHAWQTSSSIFLYKSGKKNPHNADNWRTINLSSCLLKLLEKVVLLYLNDTVGIDSSLSNQQLGFRKGRSTDEALHRLVSQIESSLSKGIFALSCFVDIKAAFDSISFNSIITALYNHGVNESLIKWITSLLGQRQVIFALKGVSLLRFIIKGTPQGGVLSPLLWNIVIDSLLVTLCNVLPQSDFVQGFADDLVTLVTGSDINKLMEKMQSIVNIINEWCITNGLELSTEKTRLVLFTWKRKFSINYPVIINNEALSFSTEVKYLGLILDHKLNWKKHIDYISGKANQSLNTAKRTIGKNWGLSAKTVKWLYKSVVLPTITYGCHVWGLNQPSYITERLSKIQSLATRTIIHCPKFTSNTVMNLITGLPPISSLIKYRSYATLFRLHGHRRFESITNSRTKFQPHSASFLSFLQPAIEHWDINRTENFGIPKFTTSTSSVDYMNLLRTDQQSAISQFDYTAFTDGSKLDGQVGAGSVIYNKHSAEPLHTMSWRLQDDNTVYQAELFAIKETCIFISTLPINHSNIYIFSDCRTAITMLSSESAASKICIETRQIIDIIADSCHSLNISWIKSHSGIPGNELADTLAKNGTTNSNIVSVPLPGSLMKRNLSFILDHAQSHSVSTFQTSNPLHNLLCDFSNSKFSSFFTSLNRRNSRILSSFLDNKAPLLSFLYKIYLVDSPICNLCCISPQDNIHILSFCPAVSHFRFQSFGTTRDPLSVPERISPHELLQFLTLIPLYKDYLAFPH